MAGSNVQNRRWWQEYEYDLTYHLDDLPNAAVTTAVAQNHLRLPDTLATADDTRLEAICFAATEWVERTAGVVLVPRTVTVRAPRFPNGYVLELPLGPINDLTLTAFTYYDEDNASQDFTADPTRTYRVQGPTNEGWPRPFIELDEDSDWPDVYTRVDAVEIQYEAGYAQVPRTAEQLVLLMVAQWWEQRLPVDIGLAEIPMAARTLLNMVRGN